ncbi:DUF3050 domain-containing protein [Algoriphagus sp. CAU 1675]|uniref:DUF3050 domain-containing protein n=1 Tax=Algoriphagus sp. CAU 1675 TaxID=3032597 RepID=UPI0023DB382F|nr:DUF3050 domain-containing protein [Algoriphagus sp. CAU 1675]MDF2156268.1 DUF3050 domain-containing protein [Algoriphagus sp. CAU 1675]
MSESLKNLIGSVAADREELLSHPLYQNLNTIDDFRVFMEYHVFAVWDFMSLLKALQIRLTGVNLPWIPAKDPQVVRLINDIVLAEESDEDGQGGYCSHFELYLRAMNEAGAQTYQVDQLVKHLSHGKKLDEAMEACHLPDFVKNFLRVNYQTALFGKPHEIAASFTLGREDLIPDLFRQLVNELIQNQPGDLDTLAFYFDRHIHLDEEEHGPLAWKMVDMLLETDLHLEQAKIAAKEALEARKLLWDGINEMILKGKESILL